MSCLAPNSSLPVAAISAPSAPRPHVQCIINTVPVSCLVDSGASITCIHPSVLRAIRSRNPTAAPASKDPFPCNVSSASGSPLSVLSRNTLCFTTPGGVPTSFPAFVIDNLSSNCILGTDFLKSTKAKADFTTNTISFNGGHVFSLCTSIPELNASSLATDCFPVLANTSTTTIPPFSSRNISTKILLPPSATSVLAPGTLLECHGDPSLILNGVISVLPDTTANVTCINLTSSPRLITKGTDLAHVSALPARDELLELLPASASNQVSLLATEANSAAISALPTVAVTNTSWQPTPAPVSSRCQAGRARPLPAALSLKEERTFLRKTLSVQCPPRAVHGLLGSHRLLPGRLQRK